MKVSFCKQCGTLIKDNRFFGYCSKHYTQLKKYGECKDSNPRTVWDPNEIRVKNDITEIDTYDAFGNVNNTFLIDTEDIPILNLGVLKWKSNLKHGKNYYLYTQSQGYNTYFHRLVMGLPNQTVDHINRNTLDNRKCNLRIASKAEQNRNIDRGNIKGIYCDKRYNKYFSSISKNKKSYHSRSFNSYEEAVYWRYLAEECIYKDDAFYFNNRSLMYEEIKKLSEEQKLTIQLYFRNKSKDWV